MQFLVIGRTDVWGMRGLANAALVAPNVSVAVLRWSVRGWSVRGFGSLLLVAPAT